MKIGGIVVLQLAALTLALPVEAQKPIVYPAKGQSLEQQKRDDAECYAWAKQTTGIDPVAVASTPPPQQTGPAVGGGQRVRGSVVGAAGGAAIGAIAGDAGAGAGIGALVGTMAGGRRARQQQANARRGSACAWSLLGLVALGDAGIDEAKSDGQIREVSTVDYESFNILGVFATFCTVVRGA